MAASRQDTVMYVVTVKTPPVKEPLCPQVKRVQAQRSWHDGWRAKYECVYASAQRILFLVVGEGWLGYSEKACCRKHLPSMTKKDRFTKYAWVFIGCCSVSVYYRGVFADNSVSAVLNPAFITCTTFPYDSCLDLRRTGEKKSALNTLLASHVLPLVHKHVHTYAHTLIHACLLAVGPVNPQLNLAMEALNIVCHIRCTGPQVRLPLSTGRA